MIGPTDDFDPDAGRLRSEVMMTKRTLRYVATLSLLALSLPTTIQSQVVERDVSITGPRGNTIERQIRTERVGNVIDRQINIRRPGGTYHRETEILVPRGPVGRPGPAFYGGPRFIGPSVVAAPAFSFFLGSAPPPPPVFIAPPPPLYVAPQPIYIAPPQPVAPPDAVSIELSALGSLHSNRRRDAAIALGKYYDPRAVPSLIDRLKNDHEKDVRQAAAWALAEIGDSRAIVPLEVAAQFDKKPDVRAVASKSLARMPTEQPITASTPRVAPSARSTPARTLTSRPADSNIEDRRVAPSNADDEPPPDPTPSRSVRSEPDAGFGYPQTSR
jgi:hypothetical protein